MKYIITIFWLFQLLLFMTGCYDDLVSVQNAPADVYAGDIAHKWLDMELKLIKAPGSGFTPPVASRALGYTGLTLYESVVPGMEGYQSLRFPLKMSVNLPKIRYSQEYHWGLSANAAMAQIIRQLYDNASEENLAAIDALEQEQRTAMVQSVADTAIANRSEAFGRTVADAIYLWSSVDGGHMGYAKNTDPNYVPPVGPGLWVPTSAAFPQPVQPYWGRNRAFVPENLQPPCLPSAPREFSTDVASAFYQDALRVYEVSISLTQGQKDIALFWADGGGTLTPPGHSMSIARQVLVKENAGLGRTAEVYAKVGMAVSDAFVSCWKGKYLYNVLRPVTFIRQYIDEDWSPFITTPSFPEYCSGHSTQSGASIQVLTDLFGDNYTFTDRTHEGTYAPRTFTSFMEAGQEATVSRLYGGIHYEPSNDRGLVSGIEIGKNISNIAFKK
jgi:hypothetical protein